MSNLEIVSNVTKIYESIRKEKPLVHQITNYVTVNDCANITLAIGASPIMVDDINEVADIAKISSALVINIGTLTERTITSMIAAGREANKKNIPVVLDPVGAGASPFRDRSLEQLFDSIKFTVIRGNLSEIKSIGKYRQASGGAKGVDVQDSDASLSLEERIGIVQATAKKFQAVVVATGAVDIITDGVRSVGIHNGHSHMSNVTGTGCMCAALIGSFCGVQNADSFYAAVGGTLLMGIAGELAAPLFDTVGSSSYRCGIIDQTSRLSVEIIVKMAKMKKI